MLSSSSRSGLLVVDFVGGGELLALFLTITVARPRRRKCFVLHPLPAKLETTKEEEDAKKDAVVFTQWCFWWKNHHLVVVVVAIKATRKRKKAKKRRLR